MSNIVIFISLSGLIAGHILIGIQEDEIEAHQSAMLTMVDRYIADTKDVPTATRCIKISRACETHYLRTGN